MWHNCPPEHLLEEDMDKGGTDKGSSIHLRFLTRTKAVCTFITLGPPPQLIAGSF
jgi:hypothetical protein